MKKVLILQWNQVNDNYSISRVFEKFGMKVTIVDLNAQDCRDSHHSIFFETFFLNNEFDLVYSTNYFDYLAENCHNHGIPYIAWSYDSPVHIGDTKTLTYDTTNLFLFDSTEVRNHIERKGYRNIHYLPLAADIDRFQMALNENYDKNKYNSQISFVGSLYDGKTNEYLNKLSDYHKGFFNAVVDGCVGKYDECIGETINGQSLFYWKDESEFNELVINDSKSGVLDISVDEVSKLSSRVARLAMNSVTNRERLILASMLSRHWQFKLYSTSSHKVLETTIECGGVDYYTDMPKVFRNSKINLNVTNKGIKAGIPLRCMDIMGCGGLLLTNYQKDFEEHFVDGKNIVLYHNFEEAYEKCEFYLLHEEIRSKVANEGFRTVRRYYTLERLLRQAIELSGLGYLIK